MAKKRLEEETLNKILEHSAQCEQPLDDQTLQELAELAGMDGTDVLKRHNDRREELAHSPMPMLTEIRRGPLY